MSAAVMPPRCAVAYCCKCAELCKSIGLGLESMLFMPCCSNNLAQNKDKNTGRKEKREARKRLVASERGAAGAFSRVGVEGVCHLPAVLAVSLLYVRPAY